MNHVSIINAQVYWNSLQLLALIYVAIFVPVRVAWSNEPDALSAIWFVELAIDVYFLIDIVLNFRVRPAITVCRDAPWRLSDSVCPARLPLAPARVL